MELNSPASASQAAAAASIDPAPGPAYMRPELISGGSAAYTMWQSCQRVAIALAASVAAQEPPPVPRVVTKHMTPECSHGTTMSVD
ncbi:hypothetical protein MLAC_02060 [Mycobacterium lacus]|uniref:Uncharacterized protein n=1 Tax=Mycobacterium lacus TaxID=169765 RepID=A0A7I7NE00_9MYCO|nr:hypothetical protein MLAC_02060 [Mycobacterium lacus]